MEVKDVDAVCAQFFEGFVKLLLDFGGFVRAGGVRVPFCCEGEAAVFPLCFAGEGFLLAADVDAGGVDFGVAGALEGVEDFVVGGDVGDAGALVWVGAVGGMFSRLNKDG